MNTIDELRLEQIYGFVYLLLFYKHVKKTLGKQKALKILAEAARERRLSWYANHKNEIKKGRDDFETVLNCLNQITKELSPGQKIGEIKPKIIKKSNRLFLETCIWCPIAQACRIVGINPNEVCVALCQEAEDSIIKKINPRMSYKLIKSSTHSDPQYQCCKFLIEKQ